MLLRRLRPVLALVIVCTLFAGCGSKTSPLVSSSDTGSEESPASAGSTSMFSVNLADYDALTKTYLDNAVMSCVTKRSWNSASEIDPDDLVVFYAFLASDNEGNFADAYSSTGEDGNPLIPAKAVEESVMRYFDVSAQQIRQSGFYKEDSNTYEMCGLGGAASAKVVKAQQNDNRLMLDFEVYSGTDDITVLWGGTLTLELLKEGFKYVSCMKWDTTSSDGSNGSNLHPQAYKKILIPAFISGITAASWKSAEEILPDQLVTFFVLDFMEKQNPNGWNGIKEVPAEEVEDEIQKHFDVSTEHLRQAEGYNKDKNIYAFGYGFGGGADLYFTKAYQKDSLTYVEFEYKNVDVVIRKGTIVLDDTGEECKYISCESNQVN